MRPANTARMMASLKGLQHLMHHIQAKGSEMSSPSTDSTLVTLKQSDIDGWANAIESAVEVFKQIIASGTLQPAAESAMNQAVQDLQTALNGVPQTPPVADSAEAPRHPGK